jgi:chromosome segregation ATPase
MHSISIETTSKEVEQMKADIAKLKEENDIKINTLAKVHFKELEELRNENIKLRNDMKENSGQYSTSVEQKDSELMQSLENFEVTKTKYVESINELTNEVNTLKLELKRQKRNLQINETRLASKDDELIKTHSVIDKLNKDITTNKVKENELKQAVERVRALEEKCIEQPHEIFIKTESVKVQFEKLKCQVETTNVTLASKDVELTMAYDIIDSFKQDIKSLTDQLETI